MPARPPSFVAPCAATQAAKSNQRATGQPESRPSWSLRHMDITWIYFLDAHVQAGDLLTRMFPPDWGHTGRILDPLLETIHIATLGTVVTFLISIPLAFLSARNTTPNWVTWFIGRFILVSSRSINTVVWALTQSGHQTKIGLAPGHAQAAAGYLVSHHLGAAVVDAGLEGAHQVVGKYPILNRVLRAVQ